MCSPAGSTRERRARSWGMATLFTGDTHFGHAGARALYRRPFPSVAAMDEAMVARWNEVVGRDDDVFHLGDFAVRHAAPGAVLERLQGRKHLVKGNNDPAEVVELAGWASVQAYVEVTVEGVALVLCHYAFRTWQGMGRGAWNLHGHSHGRLRPMTRQADVGVDAWDFRPVRLEQVRAAGAVIAGNRRTN